MAENRKIRTSEKKINKIYAESDVKESGYVMPAPHCHPYFELFYIENGACRFFIENNIYDMHVGDFMLIPPQVFHYTRYLFGACKRNIVFFREEDVEEPVKQLLPQQTDFFPKCGFFRFRKRTRNRLQRFFCKW